VAARSNVAVKTTRDRSKQGWVAGYTWFVKFSGQKCLVLEFGGQNQTEARVHWLKMDFFLTKKS
jgi:hypothetical protein